MSGGWPRGRSWSAWSTPTPATAPAARRPWIRAPDYLPMLMVRRSSSLPQNLGLWEVHAKMKPSAIPVPFLKTRPGCAITCTRTVWLVHPTCADPKPLAIWLPERSVRLTSREAVRAPAHSIWSARSTPAPLATSVPGEFTWICSRSGGEKNPSAGAAEPTAAMAAPPAIARPARVFLLRRKRCIAVRPFMESVGIWKCAPPLGGCWNSEAGDRPHGERNGRHLPGEVEGAVQEEGGGRGHGARPGRPPGRVRPGPPEQLPNGGDERDREYRSDDAEIGEHLQVPVVVEPVDAQAAARPD